MSEYTTNSDNNIKSLILEAITKVKEQGAVSLSDLYVLVGFDDLSLSIYDDDDMLLTQGNIDQWASFKEDPDTFDDHVEESLKVAFADKDVKDGLESLDVIRPFSVVWVDEDFEQKKELMRLDDNIVVLEDDFMKNLDKELSDFLKNLLADV